MDIVSLIKIVMKLALALVPIGVIALLINDYIPDITSLLGYISNNPVLTIMVLGMDKMLSVPMFGITFGVCMSALSVVAIFRVF
jgi:hypothetical protein